MSSLILVLLSLPYITDIDRVAISDPKPTKEIRETWLPVVKAAAEHYKLDWHLLDSLIYIESNWNPNAVSKVGAQGLTQLMPSTAKMLKVVDPFDPGQAIWGAAWYLHMLHNELKEWPKAIAAYNAGPTRINSNREWPQETKDYVPKVLDRAKITITVYVDPYLNLTCNSVKTGSVGSYKIAANMLYLKDGDKIYD